MVHADTGLHWIGLDWWLSHLGELSSPGMVFVIWHFLSGTHFLEQYLDVLNWSSKRRLKTRLFYLACISRQSGHYMIYAASASEVTTLYRDIYVYIMCCVICMCYEMSCILMKMLLFRSSDISSSVILLLCSEWIATTGQDCRCEKLDAVV